MGEAKKKQSIFDITREYSDIYDALYENEGELSEEMEAALDRLDERDLPKKLEQLAFVMQDARGEAEKAASAIRNLRQRQSRYTRTVARIEAWIIKAMEISRRDQVRTPSGAFELRFRKLPVKVRILNRERPIPMKLRSTPPPKPPPALNSSKALKVAKEAVDVKSLDKESGGLWSVDIKKLNLRLYRDHGLMT